MKLPEAMKMHDVVIGDALQDPLLVIRPPDLRSIYDLSFMPCKALLRGDILDKRRHPARLLKRIAYVQDFHFSG